MDCLYAMLIHGRLLLFAVSGDYVIFAYYMQTNFMKMLVSLYEEFPDGEVFICLVYCVH
ncbi:uncharacterized protein DC041_0000555 [Schistosoma bovis]|uniref:Uncharacterized protein n=1 Tax=Schistosoma bovis TaxID=6184 RepID=A0A430QU00_SCHBO|nr:uncharacterized protein DC041_0000555 [Schistosoma bovis]